ncbi:MAG: 2Fe-2S iron-sulfur cluster-binding protein [Acidimicrobiales bacterium]
MTSGGQGLEFVLNGEQVGVPDRGSTLLEVLREDLGIRSVKDGCSPQGQCGCCTVLVDGQPRVACVTPARRVGNRSVQTVEGIEGSGRWAEAFAAVGASQCGFCTPGIITRLAGRTARSGPLSPEAVRDAMKAHLCRCTGWQTVVEAAVDWPAAPARDEQSASQRATLEGGSHQAVGSHVALGAAGFADDAAPAGSLVAVIGADGEPVVAETLTEARALAQKVQGRRTTEQTGPPLALPEGQFDLTLQTPWVDPGYLETDASWCEPGGVPATPLANGGAFGGKAASPVTRLARELADRHGKAVRVLFSREDTVRLGPKRPPIAAGINADGSGVMRIVRTEGVAEAIESVAPGLEVIEETVAGPLTSAAIRGAGWVEALVLLAGATGAPVRSPNSAEASAEFDGQTIRVQVSCGAPLDPVVLRSYCIGAAHMAYSWVVSESLSVSTDGVVLDLTVRSLGITRAVDTPAIEVHLVASDDEPVNGSDAVFAAVAAEVWRYYGYLATWPVMG